MGGDLEGIGPRLWLEVGFNILARRSKFLPGSVDLVISRENEEEIPALGRVPVSLRGSVVSIICKVAAGDVTMNRYYSINRI